MRLFALLVAFFLTAAPARALDAGRFVTLDAVASRHIASPRVTVWLPPGYDAGERRYGVLYMHDGQNLFDRKRSNFDKVWAADKSVTRLVAAKRIEPVIIVGVDQPGPARYRQYFPQALEAAAPAALKAEISRLASGPLTGNAYLAFLADELKPRIDREYRTRPEARHTAVAGSSMGGLISLYAFAERPAVFGRAACVSTHWPLGDPARMASQRAAIEASWRRYLGDTLGEPAGRRIWFDHGDQTLDAAYGPYQAVVDARVVELGWRRGRDFESRAYAGAAHEENAWAARLDDALAWLLRP